MRTYFVSDARLSSIASAKPIEAGSSGQARHFARNRYGWEKVKVWQHRERRSETGGRHGGSRVIESWEVAIDESRGYGATEPPTGECSVCGEWQATNALVDGKRFCRSCLRSWEDIPENLCEARAPFRRVGVVNEAGSGLAFKGNHKLHGAFFAWIGAAGSVIVELHDGDARYAVSFRDMIGSFFSGLNHGGTGNFTHFERTPDAGQHEAVEVSAADTENFITTAALLYGRRLKRWSVEVIAEAVKANPARVWIIDTDGDGLDDVLIGDDRAQVVSELEATLPAAALTPGGRLPKNYRVIPFPEFALSRGDDADEEKDRIEQNRAEKDAQGGL